MKTLAPGRHAFPSVFTPWPLRHFARERPDGDAAANGDDPRSGIPLLDLEVGNHRVVVIFGHICIPDLGIRHGPFEARPAPTRRVEARTHTTEMREPGSLPPLGLPPEAVDRRVRPHAPQRRPAAGLGNPPHRGRHRREPVRRACNVPPRVLLHQVHPRLVGDVVQLRAPGRARYPLAVALPDGVGVALEFEGGFGEEDVARRQHTASGGFELIYSWISHGHYTTAKGGRDLTAPARSTHALKPCRNGRPAPPFRAAVIAAGPGS